MTEKQPEKLNDPDLTAESQKRTNKALFILMIITCAITVLALILYSN